MTKNKKMSTPRRSGRNVHRYLIKESFRKLLTNGYNVTVEKRLDNNKIADVVGIKNGNKLIVECLVKPSLGVIKDKVNNYKGQSARVVIAYPSKFVPSFPIEEYVDEILKIDVPEELFDKRSTITVTNDNRKKAAILKEMLNKDTIDDVIAIALDMLEKTKGELSQTKDSGEASRSNKLQEVKQ